MDIAEILKLFIKRKKLVKIVFGVTFVFLSAITLFKPSIYEASALIVLEKKESPISLEMMPLSEDAMIVYLKTNMVLMKSRPVLDEVIKKLGLDKEKKVKKNKETDPKCIRKNFETLIKRLEDDISVKPVRLTNLVEIAVKDKNAKRASEIANTLAQTYAEWLLNFKAREAGNILGSIDEQLETSVVELEQAKKSLVKFQKSEHVLVTEEDSGLGLARLSEITARQLAVKTKIGEIEEILSKMDKNNNLESIILSSAKITGNPQTQGMQKQLSELELKLNFLLKYWKDTHPEIINLKTEINEIKEKLNEEIKANLISEKSELIAEEQSLRSTLTGYREELINLSAKQVRPAYLQLAVKSAEKNCQALLEAKEKMQFLRDNKTSEELKIIEPAVEPLLAKGLGKKKSLLLNCMFSLFLSIGIVIFVEYYSWVK